MVIAKEVSGGEEILIFDAGKHGFNAMFCDEYGTDQLNKRDAGKLYIDKHGNNSFEIILSAYYQVDFDDEVKYLVDENGFVELVNKTKVEFDEAKRNAFDVLQVFVINEGGKQIEIISEELA